MTSCPERSTGPAARGRRALRRGRRSCRRAGTASRRLSACGRSPASAQRGAGSAIAGPAWFASPQLAHRRAAEHLGDAGAGGAAGAVRQRVGRKEAVRDDFVVGHAAARPGGIRARCSSATWSRRDARWLKNTPCSSGGAVSTILPSSASSRASAVEQRLAGLHPAARQVPAVHVGVLDQEDAARAVDHHGARAQASRRARSASRNASAAGSAAQARGAGVARHSPLRIPRKRRLPAAVATSVKRTLSRLECF